ncbi:MAG: long-chain-acyl-CoA synthetase [Caulobacterales bacterium]
MGIAQDLALIDGLVRSLIAYRHIRPDMKRTVADDLEETIDKHRGNVAIRFEGAEWTYAQLEARANRYANWAAAQGVKQGERVALLMSNRPDYIACWFGLSKLGIVSALINTNLIGGPLAHCINIAEARHVITSGDLADHALQVRDQTAQPRVWTLDGAHQGAEDLETALAGVSDARPARSVREGVKPNDSALLVYTSGTTGAPKAARMTQIRTLGMLRAFIGGGHATARDRVYLTLPLYHATGGLTGVGFALESGGVLLLRNKFSASHFWEDAVAERATVFFYIGELGRYLLNAPPHDLETKHQLRLGVGNGMRPEVWQRFVDRFKIPRLLEFYGSTEGNVNILNFDGKVGAIGRVPSWLRWRFSIRLIKYDVDADTPVRSADGLCVESDIDEPGEAIGEIKPDDPRYQFQGYTGDPKQTEKKILRNVFSQGDAWFRTGDLLRKDKDGYFYFVDRIGDTYRWKGENVSTNEVGDVISTTPGITEANVYGVRVEGQDGRAGMAAITPGEGFDLAKLWKTVHTELPSYARPVFLRIQPSIETTGTFKYRKVDLVADGFDPSKSPGVLYFDDASVGGYAPLTPAIYQDIQSGNRRI